MFLTCVFSPREILLPRAKKKKIKIIIIIKIIIMYKTALITYKAQQTGSPSYLAELIKQYEPIRANV
jgi:hypothetical protein